MIRLTAPARARHSGVERKSARELDLMRQAGRINAQALAAMRAQVRPGVTTRQLDKLAEQVIELTGSKSKVVLQPLPADDPVRRQPDITLAKQHLGWEPTTPLPEGLQKTIAWFRTIDLADYRPPTPNY